MPFVNAINMGIIPPIYGPINGIMLVIPHINPKNNALGSLNI